MTDTNVAVQQKHPLVVLRERLESRRDELKNSLPSDIKPERFIRAITTAAQINPDLLACSFASLWIACMRACRDGLLPDGVEGAIVPYKERATWIPMYRGLLKKFQQSGEFKWITAGLVYQGDQFEHYIDQHGEHFRHTPSDKFGDTVNITKVYALATTKNGGSFIAVLPIAEINKIRKSSRATREDSPWNAWPEEMMKKTALRRLSKMLPTAPQFDEEDEEPEAPVHLREVTSDLPRPSGAAAALDAFASSDAGSSDSQGAPSTGWSDEQGGGAPSEQASVRSQPASAGATTDAPKDTSQESSNPGPKDSTPKDSTPKAKAEYDPIAVAYKRGQGAKAGGQNRKQLPAEYRDPARDPEADAWLAGYDGQAMPGAKS